MPRAAKAPRFYHNEISQVQGLIRKAEVDARITSEQREILYHAISQITGVLTKASEVKIK